MANISKINLNGTEYNVHDANAVLFTPQTLTDAQKQQARENIGAGTGGGTSDAVLYTPQTLTTAQQAQARDNTGAEAQSNKVTSLSASSTDTQYPSAKCIWDLIGDVETLLTAI